MLTANELKELKIIKFEKESNSNKKYLVEIKEYPEYLNIKITTKGEIPCTEYEKKINLSSLKENRYLSICSSISEIMISLEPQLKNIKDIILSEEHENTLNLRIPLPNPLVKEVLFAIPKIEKNTSSEIKELYSIINEQQKQINKLNERIAALEEKEREREREEAQYFICKNSKIIENDREKDLSLRKWIDPNKNNFKIKLLFRMSRDGNQSTNYHQLCDGKENLLTIIETQDNIKFGGFASKSWGIPNQFIEKTFMFSLNKMKKYERLNNNNSMHDGKDCGPVFGNAWDIYIDNPMTSGGEQNDNNSVFFNKYEITNNGNFNVKEIEVFQIE